MIKVHCFVSCVCEAVKKTHGADHRPYYFGVWDADFDVREDGVLTYHSERIDHEFFRIWYEMLYGIKLHKWYDEKLSKEENIAEMLRLLENKNSQQYLMVMLDLSTLPERENKFHQSPFPHYIMLETTDKDDEWIMHDPDFRWEGILPKERILAAIKGPSAAGGYFFDASSINPPVAETVEAYFNTCIKYDCNPMTDAVLSILELFTSGNKTYPVSGLALALRELPVLAIRKYAYEHAFAFFWESLGRENEGFEAWCDEIEKLVKGYSVIQYKAMKLAMTENLIIKNEILANLEEQNKLEFKIKRGLQECFEAWCTMKHPPRSKEAIL